MDKNNLSISVSLVALLKGSVNETTQQKLWNDIVENQMQIEDYVSKIGLTLIIQSQDGYAYLMQRKYDNEEQEIPRLISRRQLSFGISLMLVLLRKELIEINRNSSDERFIISRQEIEEKVRPYLKDSTDEIKLKREVEFNIRRIVEMGFMRCLKDSGSQYEILPIVRGFVDAQWLEDFDHKLQEYMDYYSINTQQGEEENELV
ncbi:DUF4194 domain-containing protein [Konateibacter massiliensis]|uniref:DUF4194 domain-containing protein n=1 Tax=Konateibacter massiliensis TaxID=2002841 RepID=UPI0015D4AEBA|nr:DUF4194 domain-containing protein [Konateibacter massiliensis]